MRIRSLAAPVVLLALAAPLAACGADSSGDDKPLVVTSFYPLEYLVGELAGGHVRVTNLTAPGVEPHDLELRVPQVADVADADLVVYESGLQPAVDDAVAQNAKDQGLDVASEVDLADDDPHFWLDPSRMVLAAAAIEERLAEVDPDHAEDYAANLEQLTASLQEIDAAYETGLADCERDLVVTSHDAFGYLTKYGLEFAPIAGLSPDAEPSASHIAELRTLIGEEGITTVFSETLASPRMADALSTDLGLTSAVLDPIEGVEDGGSADYASLMDANLVALQQANGCRVSP